jgi:hypothetical protein
MWKSTGSMWRDWLRRIGRSARSQGLGCHEGMALLGGLGLVGIGTITEGNILKTDADHLVEAF